MDSLQDLIGNTGVQVALASLAIPVIIQRLKAWSLVQQTWVINLLVGIISLITVAAEGLISSGAESMGALGIKSAAIVGAVQYMYTLVIKPVSQTLVDAKAVREARAQAAQVQTQELVTPEAAAAMVPVPSTVEAVGPVAAADF